MALGTAARRPGALPNQGSACGLGAGSVPARLPSVRKPVCHPAGRLFGSPTPPRGKCRCGRPKPFCRGARAQRVVWQPPEALLRPTRSPTSRWQRKRAHTGRFASAGAHAAGLRGCSKYVRTTCAPWASMPAYSPCRPKRPACPATWSYRVRPRPANSGRCSWQLQKPLVVWLRAFCWASGPRPASLGKVAPRGAKKLR